MNFAATIARFKTAASYTVARRAATTVGSDGYADAGSSSTFAVVASVQAMSGRELQRLPEGLRVAERRKLYTTTELRVLDVITIGSETWEVEGVEDCSTLGNYWKTVIARVGS